MVRLKIEYLPVKDLKPYKKNARRHGESDVEAIEESIEAFDFSDPIGIAGPDNEIVEGHGRLQAAKKLGLKEVPVIRLDHLTEEQRNAYRLAHNRTAELSEWDDALLREELQAIDNLNMLDFGFSVEDFDEPDEETEYYGSERERTFNGYNLREYNADQTCDPYDLATLRLCEYIPDRLIGFNEMLTATDHGCGVHFFIDDYQFERIWADPDRYIPKLADFSCTLTPDFSLYADMPRAMKIWNVYRSRLLGQMMQKNGLNVIPTIQFAGEDTLDWCFKGIEGGGTVATSTVGVMRDSEARKTWNRGMEAALGEIQPKTVVCYGKKPDFDFGGFETVFITPRKFS